MKSMLGIEPPDDRRGCLQDIHWYVGYYGYFPAYALGAVIAAQLVDKMTRDIPDVWNHVRIGSFGAFTGWLKDNIQSRACLMRPQDLLNSVTGQRMNASFFKKHLKKRYIDGALS
jgi:carboxypeptidase Taq